MWPKNILNFPFFILFYSENKIKKGKFIILFFE